MTKTSGEPMDPIPLISGGEWDGKVVRKVMETLHNGETHYVEVPGNAKLRAQLGEYLSSEGISKGGDIIVTAGIQEARFLAVQVIGQAVGKIMIPEVVHPGVRELLAVRDLDYDFIEIGKDHRMLVPPAAVRNALSDEVRVLYIESPSRLTGACYEKEELAEILSLCRKQNVSLIIDSGLHSLIEGPCDSLAYCFEIDDNICIIGEAWPGCGIDELYIGYILSSEEMVKKLATQKQVISICTSAPSQNAAIVVGNDYKQKHADIIDAMKKKRIALESILKNLGANIFSTPVVSIIVCEANNRLQKKLDAAEVRYIDSTYFGKPGYIQLSVS